MSIEPWQLKQRQGLPLEIKEGLTYNRIRAWYEHWNGEVYVSFSGGKDSTVLLHQVRKYYPEVPAVFVDTGLEYPEIRDFVKTIDNVVWLKPKMKFPEVIKKYGYPVVSKEVSRYVRDLKNPTPNNVFLRQRRLTGTGKNGVVGTAGMLSKKWRFLVDSNFKVSEKCCDVMKKRPIHKYEKETKLKSFVGLMAGDSRRRRNLLMRTGCNSFAKNSAKSNPIAFWLEKDIWDYINRYNVPYSKIYDMGEKRTGCMFCMFGVHLEKGENRFQRMAKSHPAQYNYCINKLGLGEVLDFIGVKYV